MLCLSIFNKKYTCITYKASYAYRFAFYTLIHLLCSISNNLHCSYVCNLHFYILLVTPFVQNKIWESAQGLNSKIDLILSTACSIGTLFSKYYIAGKVVKYLRQICNSRLDNSTIFIFIHVLTKKTIRQCLEKYFFFLVMRILKKYNYTYFQSLRYVLLVEKEFWLEDLKNEKAVFVIKTLVENKKWINLTDFQFMQSLFTLSYDTLHQKSYVFCVYMYFSYCTVNIISSIQYVNLFHVIIYEHTINILIEYPYNALREQNSIRLYIKCIILYLMLFYSNIVFTIIFYFSSSLFYDLLLEFKFFIKNYNDIKKVTNYYKNEVDNY